MRAKQVSCWQNPCINGITVDFYHKDELKTYNHVTEASLSRLAKVIWWFAWDKKVRIEPWQMNGIVGWHAMRTEDETLY